MFVRTIARLAGICAVVGFFGCQEKKASPAAASEAPVMATVNGVPILRSDFDATLRHARRTFQIRDDRLPQADKAGLAHKILQKMIEDELLIQYARAQGVLVSPEEVEEKQRTIKEVGGGEQAYQSFVQEVGLDASRVRANLERNLLIERLAERLRSAETVSGEEVAAYYQAHPEDFRSPETLELAHILFRGGEGREDPLSRARRVQKEIAAGLAFEKAAARYTDDTLTRDQGGALGTLKPGELLPALEEAAFSLKAGDVSPPVRSPEGFHLLKVESRRSGRARTLEEVREEIKRAILDHRVRKEMEELVKRLTREGVIQLSGF